MDSQLETWRVVAFGSGVYHLSQQKDSRLASKGVRKETFVGKTEYFDRLGLATAQDKVGRNSDTPNLNIEHTRRAVTTVTREWATLVDRKDKVQNIHSPENEYQIAARAAHGRKMDQVLIAAALGYAYTGEAGTTATALGNAQKVTSVASSAIDYPNVQLLRKASYKLNAAEAVGKRYLVHDAAFLEIMLQKTELTSSDYSSIKALMNGEINSFMGFEWIRTELVGAGGGASLVSDYNTDTYKFNTTTGLYDSGGTAMVGTELCAFVYCEGGLLQGMNPNFKAAVEERADKGYSNQVYLSMDHGAVRMEEAKVVQLIYKA